MILAFGTLVTKKNGAFDDREYHYLCAFGKCRKHKTQRGCDNSEECDIDTAHLLFSPGGEFDDYGYSQPEIWDEEFEKEWMVVPAP